MMRAVGVSFLVMLSTVSLAQAPGPQAVLGAPGGNCVNVTPGAPCLPSIVVAANVGLTDPTTSTYTNQFDFNVGTSFSAPLAASAPQDLRRGDARRACRSDRCAMTRCSP